MATINAGTKVEYLGGSARAKGVRKGDQGQVTDTDRGGTFLRVKFDKGVTKSMKVDLFKALGGNNAKGAVIKTTGAKRGRPAAKAAEAEKVEVLTAIEDPIRVAKDVVNVAKVTMPVARAEEVPLKDNAAAVLAMFNALLELPVSADALGGEQRRKAWHRMVQQEIMHGQFARTLR